MNLVLAHCAPAGDHPGKDVKCWTDDPDYLVRLYRNVCDHPDSGQ